MAWFNFLRPISNVKASSKSAQESRVLVVPVDDSQHSLNALEWAVQNIYRRGDTLHLLSIVPRVAGPYPAEVRSTQNNRRGLRGGTNSSVLDAEAGSFIYLL